MARDWFTEWCAYLGHSTLDKGVVALLHATGFDDVPKVSRDDFEVDIYMSGLGLIFEDAEMYPDHLDKGGTGVGILKQVVIFIELGEDLYGGVLPFGLEKNDTPAEVAKKLGKPDESNKKRKYDTWFRDDKRELQIKYTSADDNAGIGAIAMLVELST